MNASDFQSATGVSRETLARLETYAALLEKWQAKINLVGPDTLPLMWQRHFLDSAQVYKYIPQGVRRVMDMGSGAGFPGLVLAAMLHGDNRGVDFHLVESDVRKSAFLREAARVMDIPVTIHADRIEKVKSLEVDLVTARALAALDKLLEWSSFHVKQDTQYLFLKGRNCQDELTTASKNWIITSDRYPSLSDPSGTILHLKEVQRGRPEQ